MLATMMTVVLRVQQTPASFQYKTKCVKLQCALRTNEPTVRGALCNQLSAYLYSDLAFQGTI